MLQLALAVLRPPFSSTLESLTLIYAAETVAELSFAEYLRSLAEKHANFKVYFVVRNAPPGWTQGVGVVDKSILASQCPKPDEKLLVLLCGPPIMQRIIWKNLVQDGYSADSIAFVDGTEKEMLGDK